MIVLTYVDDCIIVGPSMVDIDAFVQSTKNGFEKFLLTDKRDIKNSSALKLPTLMRIDSRYHKLS